MAKPRQTSFRRILLFRILLLSIPVLLLGQYVIYKKARSSLLETARRNLTESAVRKGERIQESIQALEANLLTASETVVLKSGSAQEVAKFFTLLKKELPTNIECIQLRNVTTGQVVASTCGNRAIASIQANLWPQQQSQMLADRSFVRVTTPLRSRKSPTDASQDTQINSNGEVELVFTAPVYDSTGALSNALTIHSTLYQQQLDKPGSLAGYTVIIDESGTILEHPVANLVGRNVEQLEDATRLKILIKNALSGEQNFLHLFAFEKQGGESVAGYTAIPSPLSNNQNKKWVILAVASLDNALFGLAEINNVLFNLVLWLLGANLIATLYVARDLARPLEKLGDYALNVRGRGFPSKMPHDFKIKEFNQLVEALDSMVERLTAWAEELETAWKEAQAANQLKSEFLANTSHELRTPLNGIIGCIRLVRDGYCDDREEELEFLQRADDAAIHLLNIINDILDLSKIEAGTLSVVMESVDLRSIVKEAIDLQKVHIQQKKLQLLWSEPADSIAIQADPAKLKQVFLNVIGNAIKFTEAGSITITMRQEATPGKDGNNNSSSVVVSVKDTGIGIPLDEQKKLFRPFVMADGTRTRKYGGTGLGLAISRKLMELMGGTITLHSGGVDLGTTVEIGIPIINSSRSIAPADAASN
ncbi:sensor histidine kinase [Planktothrix sp. FACHB-1375]|uniref:Circadian input-output histidine kinase CikA n=3 Tax=Oscillatoriophycideae TaxID=1301283 RepID=A0A926VG28_9CYAN|nr:sensor histidine kinase [Aerosakkonema funiforme FACHB-1375]